MTTTRGGSTGKVLTMDTNFDVVNIMEFDILLTDIKDETIREIEIDGMKHLSEVASGEGVSRDSVLNGVTFGDYSRVLVKAVLTAKAKSLNAIMLVDTCSP